MLWFLSRMCYVFPILFPNLICRFSIFLIGSFGFMPRRGAPAKLQKQTQDWEVPLRWVFPSLFPHLLLFSFVQSWRVAADFLLVTIKIHTWLTPFNYKQITKKQLKLIVHDSHLLSYSKFMKQSLRGEAKKRWATTLSG